MPGGERAFPGKEGADVPGKEQAMFQDEGRRREKKKRASKKGGRFTSIFEFKGGGAQRSRYGRRKKGVPGIIEARKKEGRGIKLLKPEISIMKGSEGKVGSFLSD